ncbi:MAG: DUF3786 domain-containing protein [Proteobacteria bacterium]|nr:DUF3786 domain-containing protein [Pseudomonadota bacterium]
MARIDDYIAARGLAVAALSEESILHIAKRSGFGLEGEHAFRVPFLNRIYKVSYPGFDFTDVNDNEKEVPIQEQVLILHYMQGGERQNPLSADRIAYREIKGASFYFSSFVKRAIDPLKKVFGNTVSGFKKVAGILGGEPVANGDAGFNFQLLPKISLQIILWEGDDEFPPEANILFEDSIGEFLSPEDVAWLSGMLVYRLISISYQK